jgi:predicted transcriptional regulator of viral defense system
MKLLLQDGRNVFNIDDLSLIWGQNKRSNTVQSAREYAKKGDLVRIARGLYVLDKKTAKLEEIASRAYVPSYITGETALAFYGLIFPATDEITSASTKTKNLDIDGVRYHYYMLKKDVFYTTKGIKNLGTYSIATLERAIADLIYIHGGKYDFERLENVDWDKLERIGKIYGKKTVVRRIKELRRKYE